MDVKVETSDNPEEKGIEEPQNEVEEEVEEPISRPSTPSMPIFDILPKNEDEWWRPSHPPETYLWEQVRRDRQKGGYPWTLLDKDDEIDADEYLDDNVYEPVNPPPLYGTGGSGYMSRDQHETGSLDGRMIDIPPEIEIVNSEGLDGLDQPDPHEFGIDGDKEWMHSDDEHGSSSKVLFTAGIRRKDKAKDPDTPRSSIRPLTNKAITFAPETETPEVERMEEEEPQEVPSSSSSHHPIAQSPSPPKKTTTAFEILKNKAAGAAGQVRQRINKIALPVRPKFNQWEGVKLARKKSKKKVAAVTTEADQEVPDEGITAATDEPENIEHQQEDEPQQQQQGQQFTEEEQVEEEVVVISKEAKAEAAKKEKEAAAEAAKKEKEAAAEALKKEKEAAKKEKEAAAEALKKEKEAAAELAKKEKEAAAEIAKKEKEAAAEEKARKAKEQEEIKKQKAEEKQKAKEELEKKKAEEKAAKQKAAEEAKKAAEEAKQAKLEEQLAKAREAEEQRLKNKEEELQKSQQQQIEEENQQEQVVDEEGAAATTTELQEEGEGEKELPEITTPTGTGSRRKKIKKTFVQLPHLPKMPDISMPHIDLFPKKVIKRSKTPPARPQPPKMKFSRRGLEETENQLAAQYADEIEIRKQEMEAEDEAEAKANEPQIFVTQASVEPPEAATHVDWIPPKSITSKTITEEAEGESGQGTSKKPQPSAKERFDKFGKQLSGFGTKSKEIASQSTKAMGQTMKVIGKDLQKLGVKTSEKFQATIEEIKAKQEAAKARTKQKAKEAEDIEDDLPMEVELAYESATEPRRKFRFKRRGESQDEQEEVEPTNADYYNEQSEQVREIKQQDNNEEGETDEGKRTRSQLLGRADRDWESPLELSQSRDVSEEPGNYSSRDSPPGSSMASSTFAHVRKQGVLEEIDSDEFFLREKGISEGEDEEEINRFLVEELRQAFRPQQSNALAGFDLPNPPERPGRQPRKPPRKERSSGDKSPSYQTFPPERPRRSTPGYVSAYMHDNPEDMESNEEERGSVQEDIDDDFEDEGIRTMKEELSRMDEEINKEQETQREEYDEDDGRYEPVSEEPVKPQRTKKSQKVSTPLYYNTVAGNEWMREVEEQVVSHQQQHESPMVPRRERKRSSKSGSIPITDQEATLREEVVQREDRFLPPSTIPQSESQQGQQFDDTEVDLEGDDLEYVDEAGYAVVHKPPTTIPRKKKRSGGSSKGSSLKRQSPENEQIGGSEPAFFSLPRQSQRTFHIVPPSRPQRTYSTLKPRRPPRNKSAGSSSTKSKSDKEDNTRPSTAIGIMMQGRPLPAPPRPERSPVPMNDLDHTSIERAVGARHYANFGGEDASGGVVEEVFTATNIPPLGRLTREELAAAAAAAAGDINIGIQTDPLQEEEDFGIDSAVLRSYEEESRRVQKQSDSLRNAASYDRSKKPERPKTPVQRQEEPPKPQNLPNTGGLPPQYVFPRRLHLDELEVDVLRVNDLSAHSITVEHLSAPQLDVNSLTSVGPLSVSSIHTQTLNSDQINCNRLSSDTVDLPISIPPASFFKLASPDVPVQEQPQSQPQPQQPIPPQQHVPEETTTGELRLETTEKEEAENDSANVQDDYQKEGSAPSQEFIRSSSINEFCMTPEQPIENEDKWDQSIPSDEFSKTSDAQYDLCEEFSESLKYTEEPEPEPTEPFEDFAHCSETQQDSYLTSEEFPKSTELSESVEPQMSSAKSFDAEEDVKEEREESPSLDDIVLQGNVYMEFGEQKPDQSEDNEQDLEDQEDEDQVNVPLPVYEPLEEEDDEEEFVPQEEKATKVSEDEKEVSPPHVYEEILEEEEEIVEEEIVAAKIEITAERNSSPVVQPEEKVFQISETEVQRDDDIILDEIPTEAPVTVDESVKYLTVMEEPQNINEEEEEGNIDVEEEAEQPVIGTLRVELSEPVQSIVSTTIQETQEAKPQELSESVSASTPEQTFTIEQEPTQRSEREEDVIQLSIRLCRALTRLTVRGLQAVIDYVDTATTDDPSKAEQQRAHMQVLLCVLLILIAGILLSSRSGPSPPRWEFLMPPPDL